MRAATLEGSHVVFVVDGWDAGLDPAAIRDLTALVEQGSRDGSPVSLIRVGRVEPDGDDAGWPAIGLERLTRSEAETYVDARGQAAGCRERVFTSRALTRLHAWSEGVPRSWIGWRPCRSWPGRRRGWKSSPPRSSMPSPSSGSWV